MNGRNKKKWHIYATVIATFVVLALAVTILPDDNDSRVAEQDYQNSSQYRPSIAGKLLGPRDDGCLFYSLFKDIDIFEKDKKFLWIVPTVEMFRSDNLFDTPEPEFLPAIKITYDLSYLHGETYKFEFYAEYKHYSVFYASAELTYLQEDGKVTTRQLSWSNDTGGDNEIKHIAETIHRWWRGLAEK